MEVTKEIMDALGLASACIFPEDIETACKEHFSKCLPDAYLYAQVLKRNFVEKGIIETYRAYAPRDPDMQTIICALLTKHS